MTDRLRLVSARIHGLTLSSLKPPVWVILLALAIPFLIVIARYLEELERTGPLGALIADLLVPVSLIGYIALVVVLRKMRI